MPAHRRSLSNDKYGQVREICRIRGRDVGAVAGLRREIRGNRQRVRADPSGHPGVSAVALDVLAPLAHGPGRDIGRRADVPATVHVTSSFDPPVAMDVEADTCGARVRLELRRWPRHTVAHPDVVALIEGAAGRVEVDVRREAATRTPGDLRRPEASGSEAERAADLPMRLTREDVHDAAHGRGPVHGRRRAFQHLDAIHVVEEQRGQVRHAGRPSIDEQQGPLVDPDVCGRNPRMPMPDSAPVYWTTSTPAFFFSTSVRSAATVRSMSAASTTSIF